jgi:hypothetical protein
MCASIKRRLAFGTLSIADGMPCRMLTLTLRYCRNYLKGWRSALVAMVILPPFQ